MAISASRSCRLNGANCDCREGATRDRGAGGLLNGLQTGCQRRAGKVQRFAFEAMRAAFDLVACLSGDRRLQGIQQTVQFVDKHRRQLVEQRRIVVQLRERKRIIEGEHRSRDDLRNFLRQFLQQDGFGNVTVKAELQAFSLSPFMACAVMAMIRCVGSPAGCRRSA